MVKYLRLVVSASMGRIALFIPTVLAQIKIRSAYNLIDFSDSASTRIELPVKVGICNGIQFLLGVDSTDQVRGSSIWARFVRPEECSGHGTAAIKA